MTTPPESRRDSCLIPRGVARLVAVTLQRDARRCGFDTHRLLAAMLLACQVHRHQQRSADAQPFVVHPLQAALLVCRWGGSPDDVLAAVLHDAAEDSTAGPRAMLNHIADLFGTPVAHRVAALTKNRGIADGGARDDDHARRLLLAVEALGPGVAAIRLADRLHNCVTSAHFEGARLQRLHRHTQQHLVPLARHLRLAAVAGFLAAQPTQWHTVAVPRFMPAMLALQPPWLGEAGRAAQEAAACQGANWPRLQWQW